MGASRHQVIGLTGFYPSGDAGMNHVRKKPKPSLHMTSESLFHPLFEQSPIGLAVVSEDELVRINEPFAAMFGYAVPELTGRSWQCLVAGKTAAHLKDSVFSEAIRAGRWSGEIRGKRKDDSSFDVELYLIAGPDKQIIFHCRDITRAKNDEFELSRKSAERERAERMREQFLASMSHELRTPLAGILGLAEVLREGIYGDINPQQTEAVRAIEQSGRHLLDLINDILDLSKIESGHVEIDRQQVNVSELCASAMHLIRSPASKKLIVTSLVVNPPDLVATIDPKRFKQMLVNLLDNAIKFTPVGGRVDVHVDLAGENHLQLSVTDNGRGITKTDIQRIFLPFEQADRHLSRAVNGAGLGLSLVQRLAELHGGGITVQSAVGKGSCFTVTLPCQSGTTPIATETIPDSNAHLTAVPPNANRVAIIEDNLVTSRILVDFLSNRGFECLPLLESSTAITRLCGFSPNAILMDIQMPIVDGFELAARVRSSGDSNLAIVPIIALTALAMPGDRERCLRSGMNEYMTKPFKLGDVHETLCRFIRQSIDKKS